MALSATAAELAPELEAERWLLTKAQTDIEQGRVRLRNQEDLLAILQASGHDTLQAERLVLVLRQTLVEWERHRNLIEQRIEYLRRRVENCTGQADPS